MAVIALCEVATVATAGACGVAAVAAIGSLKWALIGSAIGAAGGAFKGALSYMKEHDTLDGSGSHILEESAKGFSKGAITGAVSGAMAGAAKYAKAPTAYCFAAGTLVLTLAGMTAIENIKPGDMVYAKEAKGIEQSVDTDSESALNPVLEVYEREVYETYKLTISPSDNSLEAEVIETTAYHPFYTEYGEAIEAKDLKEGDKLLTSEGDTATVEKTEKITYDEPIIVYNFAVLDTHTYYVGEIGVLVHNSCGAVVNAADDVVDTVDDAGDVVDAVVEVAKKTNTRPKGFARFG